MMPSVDIDAILHDPATSPWLHMALTTALQRNTVDAAADAAVLVKLLDQRLSEALREELRADPPERAAARPIAA